MKYILDTNIFNWLIDGKISLEDFPADADFIASHIQIDELSKTKDFNRKNQLIAAFHRCVVDVVPTETALADISRADCCKAGDGELYEKIMAILNTKNKGKANNSCDALIGEIATKNKYMLVTADKDLAATVVELGCRVTLYQSSKE